MERESMTLDIFQKTLEKRYTMYKRKCKDVLLDGRCFEDSVIGIEDLRLLLQDDAFFEVTKGTLLY
jgi:hypothetical protein